MGGGGGGGARVHPSCLINFYVNLSDLSIFIMALEILGSVRVPNFMSGG